MTNSTQGKRKNNNKSSKFIITLWCIFISVLVFSFLFMYLISIGKFGYMPDLDEIENPKFKIATEVISADSVVLGTFFAENRTFVKYNEISPHVINALIATEDIRFYQHSGIDLKAILRVLFTGGKKGGGSTISQQLAKLLFPREEFSTLIQKITRKLREWIMAVKIERRYTKEEIITLYLNKFDFLNLAVGIKSAAKVYFNKTQDKLNIEEAAMLIGMCKNPSLYNPLKRPELTLKRRNIVLHQMYKYNFISQQQYDSLKKIPLKLNFQRVDHKEGIATHFREFLRLFMTAKKPDSTLYTDKIQYSIDTLFWNNNPLYGWCNKNYKPDGNTYDLYKDGLKIYVTIDSRMQKYAEDAVKEHIGGYLQKLFYKDIKNRKIPPFDNMLTKKEIEEIIITSIKRSERYQNLKKRGLSEKEIMRIFKIPVKTTVFSWEGEKDTLISPYDSILYHKYFLRASLVSIEPQTGHVKAYVGNINFKYFAYDMVFKGRRQVGSTFKPFLYALAMQEGLTPCYEVPNLPVTFEMPDGTLWIPKNSSKTKRDGQMVTLRWALANSINYISAWLMKRYSPEAVVTIARKMGIYSHLDPVPSLCLGVSDISLLEMTSAFSTFANKGIHVDPIFVTHITDAYGNVLANFKPKQTEAISEETAFKMIDLLRSVVQQGTSWRLKGRYNVLCDVAAKTGTTQNQSDGWYIGVIPNLATGIWVGGEERSIHFRSLELGQGANMALPIWAYFMKKVFSDNSLNKKYSPHNTFIPPSSYKPDPACYKTLPYEKPDEVLEGIILN
ncbi:MAG: transglycosylase domain-containing protein [Bacteroidales bacterium]|nr:transglycosylase domain-containing protein [Bacteroidales bacterium]